ncbi:Uncharacterised protein [Vibrio cholerae]|nr:Uncharacterised protein [Vibrio cholerae]
MQSSSKAQSSRQKMMPHYTECLEKKQKFTLFEPSDWRRKAVFCLKLPNIPLNSEFKMDNTRLHLFTRWVLCLLKQLYLNAVNHNASYARPLLLFLLLWLLRMPSSLSITQ